MSAECYELSTPANRRLQGCHGRLAGDFPATNSLMRDDLRSKSKWTIYRVIVVAFCFAIVFVGLLLIVGRVDTFTGYRLICLTPPG